MNIDYFNNLSTGFYQMGEAVNNKLLGGNNNQFTGLKDTPTGYQSGYYLRSTESGIEYIDVTGLAADIGDEIVNTIITGQLLDFTGLKDTPGIYESGYYLRSTESGIEYIDVTGLAADIGDEIINTIITGQLLDFTGLKDTPGIYESGYYLRSTESGIEYIDVTGLAADIGDEIVNTIITGQLLDFTGLKDTPGIYESGYYLRSTESGIEYVDVTGLAADIGDEIVNTIITGQLLDFTGLKDTPGIYESGYYLRSTESGIEYIDVTGLAADIGDEIVNTIITGQLLDFTGLKDTPGIYESGYYLRSTESGIEYIDVTGLAADIGDEIVNTIITGQLLDFTGLSDTPTGYKEYNEEFFLVPSGDRLVYDTVRFLENVKDRPVNELVSGFLRLVEDENNPGNLVLAWSAGTTDGDIAYNISGATHFTGLFDTPTGYLNGYYVKVGDTQNKLEYISPTGLAQDISENINKLLTFTKLKDTPGIYESGYYLRSTESGIEYIDVTGLAADIGDEIVNTIITGKLLDFTGLKDTPGIYESGYYLRSTESGIEYIDATGLAADIGDEIVNTIVTGQLLDFTGLKDTPGIYESGYYLRSTESGIEYVDVTGLAADIGDEIVNTIITGQLLDFTGLKDTPGIYESGYYLRSTESGIEYIDATGLAADIGDEIVNTIVTGQLLDFTGLKDTPGIYESGYYLRSTESGIEYIDATGLAADIGDEIVNTIITGQLLDFTGLKDTPGIYESGYYLRSAESGIEYIDVTGLAADIGDEIINTIITGQLLDFTGLKDTPGIYESGYYLRSTESGIEYIDATGLAADIGDEIVNTIVTGQLLDFTGLKDTPGIYESGYYLRSTESGIEYIDATGLAADIGDEIVNTIVTGQLLDFTGLKDTPGIYESGYYLRSTESGIEYIDATGLAADIGDEIVNTIVTGQLLDFTGLSDTPNSFASGKYLRVNDAGNALEYVDITGVSSGGSSDIPKYTNLPDPTENDGKIVASGCDLYYGCDGAWKKIGADSIPPPENVPGCISNLQEYVQYQEYKDGIIEFYQADALDKALNGGSFDFFLSDVCLFKEVSNGPESNCQTTVVESNYKWAIVENGNTINIKATTFSGAVTNQTELLIRSDTLNTSYLDPLSTEFMIQSNTTDGDTNVTDSGLRSYQLFLPEGNVSHSSSVTKYGSTSLFFNGGFASISNSSSPQLYSDSTFNFLHTSQDYTISFWLNGSLSTNNDGYCFQTAGVGNQQAGIRCAIVNSTIYFDMTSNGHVLTSSPLNDNQWYYIKIINQNIGYENVISLYIDGSLIQSHQVASTSMGNATQNSAYPLTIGRNHFTSKNLNNIFIQDFTINKGQEDPSKFTTVPQGLSPVLNEVDNRAAGWNVFEDLSFQDHTISNERAYHISDLSNIPLDLDSAIYFPYASYLKVVDSKVNFEFIHQNTSAYTLQFWCYFVDELPADETYLAYSSVFTQLGAGFRLIFNKVDNMLEYDILNGSLGQTPVNASGSVTASDLINQWNHISVVNDTSIVKLYFNGNLIGQDSWGPQGTSSSQSNVDVTFGNGGSKHPDTSDTYNTNNNMYLQDIRIDRYAMYNNNFQPLSNIESGGNCSFVNWKTADNSIIGDVNSSETTALINNDVSITGVFNCV